MKHKLKIIVSKKPTGSGVLSYKRATIGKKLFKKLFGEREKIVILVPGDTVEDIVISEVEKGGDGDATKNTSDLQS